MLYSSLFLIELLVLFLLSKILTNLLFSLFYRLTRSKKASAYLVSILFFPGTTIHEFAHYATALLLQVPVGKMELLPNLEGNNLKLGSVQIAKSDPIRRFLIGASPSILGTTIIIGTFFYAVQYNIFNNNLSVIFISYLVFEIGNTMFSSRKDMEGAIELFLVLGFMFLTLDFAGLRIPQINPNLIFQNPIFKEALQKVILYLIAPIAIDTILIAVLKLLKH